MGPADPTLLFQDQVLTPDEANFILSLSWNGWYSWPEISRTFNLCWRHKTTPQDIRGWCGARRQEFQFTYRQFKTGDLHKWYYNFYADYYYRRNDPDRPSVQLYLAKCFTKALHLAWDIQSLPCYPGTAPPPPRGTLNMQRSRRKLVEYEASGLWALGHEQGRQAYMQQFGCIGMHFPYFDAVKMLVRAETRKENEDLM